MVNRVLLTGAGGFVGSHVLRHFLEHTDWKLYVVDSYRGIGCLDRIHEQLRGEQWRGRLQVVPCDLRMPFSRQLTHQLAGVDTVVSIASDSDVDRSISNPRGCIENNVALIVSLLEFAREREIERFVHLSTDEVYGPAPDGYAHAEGERHRPSNPYAASKACQEDICYAYWRTYDVPAVIVNSMNLIGEMQHRNKFVPSTIAKVLRGETAQIHASPNGRVGSRYYLHARNLAAALLFVLGRRTVSTYSTHHNVIGDMPRFNVVGEREIDNLEMAQMIAGFANRVLDYELVDFHSSRPGHDLRYALDGSLLSSLGWDPPLALEESLRRTVEWTIDHPEWLLPDEIAGPRTTVGEPR